MPEREPPAVLLDELAAARRRGCTFELAWETALATALRAASRDEREEWMTVLAGMVESWRLAYDRVPARPGELALMAVATDPDRVPVRGRWCARCSGPIPHERAATAKFCGDRCRRAAYGRHPGRRRQPVGLAVG